jgi:hypothetical protein
VIRLLLALYLLVGFGAAVNHAERAAAPAWRYAYLVALWPAELGAAIDDAGGGLVGGVPVPEEEPADINPERRS